MLTPHYRLGGQSLLFGVPSIDAGALAVVCAGVATVALSRPLTHNWRATRIDPLVAVPDAAAPRALRAKMS
jgi:hypothetical protein